jgi:hypothetical protein
MSEEAVARKVLNRLAAHFWRQVAPDEDEPAGLPPEACVSEVLGVCERLFGELITKKALALPPDMDVVDAVRELQCFRRTLRREWLPSLAPIQARLESLHKLPGATPAQWEALARTPHGFFERLLYDCGLIKITWCMRHSKSRNDWVKQLFRRARKVIVNEALRLPPCQHPSRLDPPLSTPRSPRRRIPRKCSRRRSHLDLLLFRHRWVARRICRTLHPRQPWLLRLPLNAISRLIAQDRPLP